MSFYIFLSFINLLLRFFLCMYINIFTFICYFSSFFLRFFSVAYSSFFKDFLLQNPKKKGFPSDIRSESHMIMVRKKLSNYPIFYLIS